MFCVDIDKYLMPKWFVRTAYKADYFLVEWPLHWWVAGLYGPIQPVTYK